MKPPKADKDFLSTVPFFTEKRTKGKKISTKVCISHINHKSLKWITERGCELDLPILST